MSEFKRLKELFDWYILEYKICKNTFLANRYMKDVLGIPSETLRKKKKDQTPEFKEMKKKIIKEFTKLINTYVKEGKLAKIESSSAYELIG